MNCEDQLTAVKSIIDSWKNSNTHHVVNYMYYANYILTQKDNAFNNAMSISDFILVDGIGMQLYFKLLKGLWLNNLNGTDLNPIFIKELDQQNIPIALYGTTKESIENAVKNLSLTTENKTIYFFQDGYSPLHWSQIKEHSVLFIGLGSPLQENWIIENIGKIKQLKLLVITVGGFFDFASGFYIRAPKWVRKIKMEWAWRTMLHPKRHLKKRLRDLTIFYKPIMDKIKGLNKKIEIKEIN